MSRAGQDDLLRRGLLALAARGRLRVRELDGGLLKIAPPKGSPAAAVHVVFNLRTRDWSDPESGEVLGRGWWKLAARIALPIEDACSAYGGGL